jgi:hypothetical protein
MISPSPPPPPQLSTDFSLYTKMFEIKQSSVQRRDRSGPYLNMYELDFHV